MSSKLSHRPWQRPSQARAHIEYLENELRELDVDPNRSTLDWGICASHQDAVRLTRAELQQTKCQLAKLEREMAGAK